LTEKKGHDNLFLGVKMEELYKEFLLSVIKKYPHINFREIAQQLHNASLECLILELEQKAEEERKREFEKEFQRAIQKLESFNEY
jgi:ADP-heptose:LPS heptosyltransferase